MTHVRGIVTILTGAAVLFAAATLLLPPQAGAQSTPTYNAAAVAKGLQLSPVPIDLNGRNRDQVGYGSYLVNAAGGCNDCHTNPPFAEGRDPFLGQPKRVNAPGFLAGGQAFGPFISRNLTPSADGPVTGSLANFKTLMRTGLDTRALHPEFGPLLQVMPWPVYGELLDADLEAIYAYLSSIPCVEGGPGEKANRCTPATPTAAVAEPKNATVQSFQYNLDGRKSTSATSQPLQYRWTVVPGSPPAAILFADTATPTVQFAIRGPVEYRFQLTVTDSAGRTATDTASVMYVGR